MIDLDQCIAWANTQKAIRALVLVGSRSQKGPVDAYADIDLLVFTDDLSPLQKDDSWLAAIGPHWICVHDMVKIANKEVPTRLVIFEEGVKVDFTFSAVNTSHMTVEAWWQKGQCTLLVDKDGALEFAKNPFSTVDKQKPQPSQEEFIRIVNEFWFEVYHVAKYLARDDLWSVKFRDWAAKEFLLTMLEWEYQASHNGKDMKSWASAETWKALHSCFAHFDAQDSKKCLFETIQLFRKLAKKVAKRLNYEYPTAVDKNISTYIGQKD